MTYLGHQWAGLMCTSGSAVIQYATHTAHTHSHARQSDIRFFARNALQFLIVDKHFCFYEFECEGHVERFRTRAQAYVALMLAELHTLKIDHNCLFDFSGNTLLLGFIFRFPDTR